MICYKGISSERLTVNVFDLIQWYGVFVVMVCVGKETVSWSACSYGGVHGM